MLRQIKIYTGILAILVFCVCSSSAADISENQSSLLDLINQIRTAPFSYALSLGYDTKFLEERGLVPDTEFEPYHMDDFLNSRAADSNTPLIGNETEVLEIEPVHLITAETGGVVTFLNFMPANIAGKIFIDYLFKQEIESKNFQYILSDDYLYVGISIESGVTEHRMNAWFLTISLGSSVLKSEGQILNLVNQVRSEPWKIQPYVDKTLIDIFYDHPNIFDLFGREYPPVFLNTSLHLSARASSFYLLNKTYPEPLAFVIGTSMEWMTHFGYNGASVRESVVACEKEDAISIVNTLFSSLVLNEFNTWPEGAVVFSSGFQDAGPGISFRSNEDVNKAVLAFDIGAGVKEADEQISKIYGILFFDKDENYLYSPGEEIAQETVMVCDEDMNPLKSVITDNAGHFSMILESNKNYFFNAEPEGFSVSAKFFVSTDQFVKLPCSLPPPHPNPS